MTDLAVSVHTSQPAPLAERSQPLKCTGRVKTGIDFMVWEGLRRDDAAAKANLTVHGLREALRKPHVKAYYLEQCEALRLSLRARGIHSMGEIVEQRDNLTAAVAAYKALHVVEQSDVSRANSGIAQTPGFLISIYNAPPSPAPLAAPVRTIEGKANDINGPSTHELERHTEPTSRQR